MKVLRNGDTPETPATAPIFVGTVHSRPLVTRDDSDSQTVTLVRFSEGGRNKRHTHTQDQVLYIVEGFGIVADEQHEHHVTGGDIVHVPAGEIHWHGAAPSKDMAHLAIMNPAATTVVVD